MVLVAIRHGESEWNKANKFTGLTDVRLSAKGEEEALQAGYTLKDCKFDAIFTSNLKRALQTASIIADVQGCPVHINTECDLNERDYGSLTGRNKTELMDEYGPEQVTVWRRSFYQGPPEGENLYEVTQRVGRCYERSIKPLIDLNKNILLVGHGNSLRAMFVYLGLKDEKSIETFEIDTGIPIHIDVTSRTYACMNRET